MNFYSQALVDNPDYAWAMAIAEGRGNLFLGFRPDALFVPEAALYAHCYIVGPPSSGKTSRVLAPIATQLIRKNQALWVVDCKPDPMLWGHVQAEAKAVGRKANFFSLQPGVPTEMALDFLDVLAKSLRTPRQIAELLVGSLGLNKTSEPFFVTQNAGALTEAITNALHKGRLSFKSLAHEMRGVVSGSKRYEHSLHALDAVEQLAAIPELNPERPEGEAFVKLIEEGALIYCCLPVATEQKLSSAAAASLMLKLTASVSKDLDIQRRRVPRIFFCIDEFQDVASTSDLKDLVAQVRGMGGGISLLLAHQVPEQVDDEGLRALLRGAGVLILLAPRQFAKELQEWSGEKIVYLRSTGESSSRGASGGHGTSSHTTSVTIQETIRPKLDLNTIQRVNGLPGFGIVVVEGGAPIPVFFPHHVPRTVAETRAKTALHQGTPALSAQPKQKALPKRPQTLPLPAQVEELGQSLSALFQALRPKVLVGARVRK